MTEVCALCGSSFASAADLLDHRGSKHRAAGAVESLAANPEASRPGLPCGLCARRFPSAESLAAHLSRPHAPPGRRRWGARVPG